ncbi:DSBA oxidoreductase [Sulfolobales archaeon HS-7]|nr:DSBA oxidoreductase [Sulfolobales archaeon HS-7]
MQESFTLTDNLLSKGIKKCHMKLKLTFFHDVICPFCYVTARRLMQALKEFDGNIEVIHKAFAIISSLEDLKLVAPTEEDAKDFFKKEMAILKGYYPEYNPDEVVNKGEFSYVWSIPALKACKVAEKFEGQPGHEKMFLRLGDEFFMRGRDITNEKFLASIAEELGYNRETFMNEFNRKETYYAVVLDEDEAHALGIHGVPSILVNDKWLIKGVPEVSKFREIFADLIENGEPKKVQLKAFWEYK